MKTSQGSFIRLSLIGPFSTDRAAYAVAFKITSRERHWNRLVRSSYLRSAHAERSLRRIREWPLFLETGRQPRMICNDRVGSIAADGRISH